MNGSVLDRPPVVPPIDERLRARRIQVRRGEGRRRLRRLIVALAITALAVAAWGATRSPLLDVDHIEVHGAANTELDSILRASGIARGDALTDVDADAASRGVGSLPWIASAEVVRSWNGTISITVHERTPAVVLADAAGDRWLVDGEGWVVAPAPATSELVSLLGLQVAPVGEQLAPVPHRLLSLAGAATDTFRTSVAHVEVDPAGEVWAILRPRPGEVDADGEPRPDGGRVRFGDARSPAEEMLAATTVLDQVDLTDLEVIDVRVPSNPVVTRVPWAVDADEEG